MSAAENAAAPEFYNSHHLSPRAKLEILFAILLALFLFALDQTVVGVALPSIITDLQGQRALHVVDHDLPADLDDQRADLRQAVRPVRPAPDLHLGGGPVPRRVGRRGVRQECGSSSSSAACRASAAARCSRSPSRSSPTSTRRLSAASTSGLFGAVFGLSSILGPAIGGIITDNFCWHWIFFVNVPIGARLAVRHLPAAAGDQATRRRRGTSTTSAPRCSRRPSVRSWSA